MRFQILSTILAIASICMAVAVPSPEANLAVRNITQSLNYPLRCNTMNLNLNDARACRTRIGDLGFNTMCQVPPISSGNFCQQGGVYVSGRAWGVNPPTEAHCSVVGDIVSIIINGCGSQGGSLGVFGLDGDVVVHVADHDV
ncbi:hypothetical protein BT63DRAFT_442719 [Microthyrium microscopicum]|uniref:Cyanovirin-N domain-containing protein n=1 Tax=Microthyrium microscopicum TaxID=703497 RepID=A0A6A6U1H6_9PEZI|nr:hypothetical protein BT63DRAFT_442719 [Microthyrium microscopicum]